MATDTMIDGGMDTETDTELHVCLDTAVEIDSITETLACLDTAVEIDSVTETLACLNTEQEDTMDICLEPPLDSGVHPCLDFNFDDAGVCLAIIVEGARKWSPATHRSISMCRISGGPLLVGWAGD